MKLVRAIAFFVSLDVSMTQVEAQDFGSYYVIYDNNTAPANCVADAGTKVDDSCCTDVGPIGGFASDISSSTRFVISGLFGGDDGPSVVAYLGCDGETPNYGEFCADGGVIPAGAALPPDTNATSPSECGVGCGFEVKGKGCHSVNDIPPQQFFMYLNEDCASTKMDPAPSPDEPEWWPLLEETFVGVNLQRCRKRDGVQKPLGPPPEGMKCHRKPKTCFFGDQECPGGFKYPSTRCLCDGTWQCEPEPCPANL